MNIFNPFSWFSRGVAKHKSKPPEPEHPRGVPVSPGRQSVPDRETTIQDYRSLTNLVKPSFRTEFIPIIRDLYKINPDVSIALQDMFKLANTGHTISFPRNSDSEREAMLNHLRGVSNRWGMYTAGIEGMINKLIVQCLIGGAISIEAVPNKELNGLATILLIKPEDILFTRESNGVYQPYQKNPTPLVSNKPDYIKLNPETFLYAGMYNDIDEPYGVPPFMAALDSLRGQHDMRTNFKHIMELMGMVGFLEAKMEKPYQDAGESQKAYLKRLENTLSQLKYNLREGLKDGVVTGYIGDHEFKLNSTTQTMGNMDKPWAMNQQSVANGLGVNSTLIGVQSSTSESGAGIQLSKMISQLSNIQTIVSHVLCFIYSLELRLAGFHNKGIKVSFNTSTISDELKVQQTLEYKVRNYTSLYDRGIISQNQFAIAMGYVKPDRKTPRVSTDSSTTDSTSSTETSPVEDSAKKKKREEDKDDSDRKTRDKTRSVSKRGDQDSRKR